MASATKVGAFVVAFVVLLAAAFALLRKSVFEPPVDRYVAEFADAGGLSTGAGVLLAGVVVGSVESVELAGSDKARVGLALRRGVQLPVGTEALLPASFISIGDQRLSLVPPPEAAGVLPPGSAIRGRRGSALEGLLRKGAS
jgi:ABC-type transport system involved in resistance to organic solvents, periplasmic component